MIHGYHDVACHHFLRHWSKNCFPSSVCTVYGDRLLLVFILTFNVQSVFIRFMIIHPAIVAITTAYVLHGNSTGVFATFGIHTGQ